MIFREHSQKLVGAHAFLSASKYHWIRYDEEKLIRMFNAQRETQRGTELHELAQRLIKQGIKLPESKKTLNMYVNDAIGFRMKPEQVVFYSENCFGTVDAIQFSRNLLRIHDYKSGMVEASMDQLRIYAAIFCLEYDLVPFQIEIELRIYQNDAIVIEKVDPSDVMLIMDKIIVFDRRIKFLRSEMED